MTVCLSGLPAPKEFDTVGEPATLQQRWTIWRSEFELFCAASGIKEAKQQRALLLHLAGTGTREIFRSMPDEKKGEDKYYKKAMNSLTEHFQLKKNIPQARQTFLTTTPRPGERINNFVTRLQTLAEHCNYNDEKDNQIRDRTLTFVTRDAGKGGRRGGLAPLALSQGGQGGQKCPFIKYVCLKMT